MDIARFVNVVWRYKILIGCGVLLASAVALNSYLRFSPSGVKYRQEQVYLSAAAVLVTQPGFPWGRAILDDVITAPSPIEGGKPTLVPRFSDPGRYSGLAALYAQLARADEVVAKVQKGSGPNEYYQAEVIKAADGTTTLPMVYIKGYGPTAEAAVSVANRATDEFGRYLEAEQDRNRIAKDKRVEVVVTQRAAQAEVFATRSFVRPVMMFLLISMGILALAFALENLRSRRAEGLAGGEWPPQQGVGSDKPQPIVPDKPHVVPPPPAPRERSSAVWSK
jgi:hypothetical protein